MTMQLAAGIIRDGTRVPTLRRALGCGPGVRPSSRHSRCGRSRKVCDMVTCDGEVKRRDDEPSSPPRADLHYSRFEVHVRLC